METTRIAALPCWSDDDANPGNAGTRPVVVEPLAGGITNRNYLVRRGDRQWVARVCRPLPHLGIERRNEAAAQRAAYLAGVAPRVVYAAEGTIDGQGVLVSDFVAGRTLGARDLKDPRTLERVAAAVRALHGATADMQGDFLYFSAFLVLRTYAATAARLGARLAADAGGLVRDAATLEASLRPFHPALCHNDLLPANLIATDRGVKLVDWEYAGVGRPCFDLASVSSNAGLSEAETVRLIEAYDSRRPLEEELAEIRILQAVSLLREALWATIQTVASDLDFDYARYAAENLAAYVEARRRL